MPKCICDGAFSGIRIAKNVCVDIKAECGIPVDATGKFAVIDRICDGFETASCLAAASSEDGMDDMCKDIITNGFGDCTAADMRLKFEAAVRPVCEPICPDCPKVDA